MSAAILIDITRCTGCERCADACVSSHELDSAVAQRDRAITSDGLSAERWCSVVPASEGRFARKSCMHCLEPSCVSACLVGALEKTPGGPVVYYPDKCIGCRYCMLACSFHVPRYEWSRVTPLMRKCDMCAERQQQGQVPACVEACPNDVLRFGEREELLAEAHRLIRDEPGRYIDRVWGETELGGTSVLYVSDVNLDGVGFGASNEASIPSLTDPVIHKTPIMAGGVLFGLWGLAAIIERRQRLMAAPQSDPEQEQHDD